MGDASGDLASAVTGKLSELSQQPTMMTRSDSSVSTISGGMVSRESTLVSMLSFPWEPSGLSTAHLMLAGPNDGDSQNASEDTFAEVTEMPPPTPIDHMHRSPSVPKDACSSIGDGSSTTSDIRLSEQQRNSRRRNPRTYMGSVGDAAISQGQDDAGLELHPCCSPAVSSESRTLGLEADFPKKEMVSPKLPFDLQPTSLSAQAGRLGLTIQNTFVHTVPVPSVLSSYKEKRSRSEPPEVHLTAASSCCTGENTSPLDLVSSVGGTPPPSGCKATAQAEEEEAIAVTDQVTTTHVICDDAATAKADADAPRAPTQRRKVRSAKLLAMMPPGCRALF